MGVYKYFTKLQREQRQQQRQREQQLQQEQQQLQQEQQQLKQQLQEQTVQGKGKGKGKEDPYRPLENQGKPVIYKASDGNLLDHIHKGESSQSQPPP